MIIVSIPTGLELFELFATIQLCQDSPILVNAETAVPYRTTLEWGGLECTNEPATFTFNYSAAYREVDQATKLSYLEVLAKVSKWPFPAVDRPLVFLPEPTDGNKIIVCPWGIKSELNLPNTVWQAVITHLRTYGLPVYLLGNNVRLQECGFAENEILSYLSITDKLKALSEASLVVGVPNEWTWAAAGYLKELAYWYPAQCPPRKWFPFSSEHIARMIVESHNIQIPIILAGLRKIIAML